MPIKNTEEPVKRFSCFRERFYHFKRVLVDFRGEHLLQLRLLVLTISITRGRHNLLQHHTTATDGAVLQQLVRLGQPWHAKPNSSAWTNRYPGILSWRYLFPDAFVPRTLLKLRVPVIDGWDGWLHLHRVYDATVIFVLLIINMLLLPGTNLYRQRYRGKVRLRLHFVFQIAL